MGEECPLTLTPISKKKSSRLKRRSTQPLFSPSTLVGATKRRQQNDSGFRSKHSTQSFGGIVTTAKIFVLMALLVGVASCLTPQEQENVREAEKYVKESKGELDGLQAELAHLRALGVKSSDLEVKEKELEGKIALAEDKLKKAEEEKQKVAEWAKAQKLARGVQLAEWAHGIVSTGISFTPFAGIAAPIIGALGALIAGYKKKEVPIA
jgi:hypothetical protein